MSAGAPVFSSAPGTAPGPLPGGRVPRRILLMQIKWMGDVLITTPAIRAVRRAFPQARIDFLTRPEGAAILHGNPHLDRVIVCETGFRGGMHALLAVARGGYDAVVDFRSTPRDAWYVAISRAKLRIGMRGRGPRNLAYTHLFATGAGPRYMAARKLEPLRALGIDPAGVTDLALQLVVGEAERSWASALLDRHGLGGDAPIVALSPVTRIHYKQWGAERWTAIADHIAATGARVLITSGPGELGQARAVAERMTQPAVYDYGSTTLRQLAALYERCVLWVGNDGGAKHVAVAVGTPTVTVFRYHEREVWTDLSAGSPHLAIERAPVLPCVYPHCGECPHLSCLEQLRVDDVRALVDTALARALAPGPTRTSRADSALAGGGASAAAAGG